MKTLKPYARSLLLAGLCLLAAPGRCPAQGREEEPPPFRSLSAAANFALALLTWEGRAQLPAVRSFQNVLKGRYEAAGTGTT